MIVLIVVAMVSFMVVGFSLIVRTEVPAAASHQQRYKAGLYAAMGPDFVQGILREATGPTRLWASGPGALTLFNAATEEEGGGTEVKTLPLHSGAPTSTATAAPGAWSNPAELNLPRYPGTPPFLTATTGGTPPSMPIKWIYVRQDGSFDLGEPPATNLRTNPLVGRFAYWTDDEGARINLNTAWKHDLPAASLYSPAHPSRVSLAALPGMTVAMADQVRAAISPEQDFSDAPDAIRFFNRTNEIVKLDLGQSGAAFSDALAASRFDLSVHNTSPELNVFNEPRIVLTTDARYAPKAGDGTLLLDSNNVPYYLDILKDPNVDAGLHSNLHPTKLAAAVNRLVTLLKREGWPGLEANASFARKYFSGDDSSVAQVAVNIIEQVRSAESSLKIVEPIRGRYTAAAGFALTNEDGVAPILGNTRRLYVTEVGVWVKPTPENALDTEGMPNPRAGQFMVKMFLELHLPANMGLEEVDLLDIDGRRIYCYLNHFFGDVGRPYFDEAGDEYADGHLVRLDEGHVEGGDGVTGTVLAAGGYAKIAFTFYYGSPRIGTLRPLRTALVLKEDEADQKYVADNAGTFPRLEVVPTANHPNFEIVQPLSFSPTTEGAIKTRQLGDPFLNANSGNWKHPSIAATEFVQTLGKPPVTTLSGLGSTAKNFQDSDDGGKVTNIGVGFSGPKGSANNARGRLESVASLGRVHTGYTTARNTAGVPWRTIRLRAEEAPFPDWMLLDLFTAPVDPDEEFPANARPLWAPDANTRAGRVNINSRLDPFGLPDGERPAGTAALTRTRPLSAALLGVQTTLPGEAPVAELALPDAVTLAERIASRTLASNALAYGPAYASRGAIAQIEGIGDRGEKGEFLLNGVVDLLSTRSNVFTVYSIGQALRQTPSGAIQVVAEQRLQTMMERYVEGNEVKIRVLGQQFLAP